MVNSQVYINKVMRFFLETYMELFICSFISRGFTEKVKEQERSTFDEVSVTLTYTFLVLILIFPLFVFWFSCFKAKNITMEAKRIRKAKFKQVVDDMKSVRQLDIEEL